MRVTDGLEAEGDGDLEDHRDGGEEYDRVCGAVLAGAVKCYLICTESCSSPPACWTSLPGQSTTLGR